MSIRYMYLHARYYIRMYISLHVDVIKNEVGFMYVQVVVHVGFQSLIPRPLFVWNAVVFVQLLHLNCATD